VYNFLEFYRTKNKGTYNWPPYTTLSYFQTSKQPDLQFSSEKCQNKSNFRELYQMDNSK
jgi:hypothetical protein